MKSAKAIKKIRQELFLRRDEFAQMLGISKQSISHYENGLRNPKLCIVKKMLGIAKKNKIKIEASDFFD